MTTQRIEIEFTDGSIEQLDTDDPWAEIRRIEALGLEILSAWRDNEPWFGLCTDMRPGTP